MTNNTIELVEYIANELLQKDYIHDEVSLEALKTDIIYAIQGFDIQNIELINPINNVG